MDKEKIMKAITWIGCEVVPCMEDNPRMAYQLGWYLGQIANEAQETDMFDLFREVKKMPEVTSISIYSTWMTIQLTAGNSVELRPEQGNLYSVLQYGSNLDIEHQTEKQVLEIIRRKIDESKGKAGNIPETASDGGKDSSNSSEPGNWFETIDITA